MTITSVMNHSNNISQKIGNNICLMSMLCRAVRGRELEISFLLSFSCLGEIILLHVYIYCVLRYTTARLQVLFSSQHLGGITKGCSNNYDSESLLLYIY